MSEPFVFDPRRDLCKEPFGAVPCGTAVTFHCRPLATEGFSHCALVLSCEFSGTQREQELPLEGFAGERLCFSGTLTRRSCPIFSGITSASGGRTAPAVCWTRPATAVTDRPCPGS